MKKETWKKIGLQFIMAVLFGTISGAGTALLLPLFYTGPPKGFVLESSIFAFLIIFITVGATVSYYGRRKPGEFLFRCITGEFIILGLLVWLKLMAPGFLDTPTMHNKYLDILSFTLLLSIVTSIGAVASYHLFKISEKGKQEKTIPSSMSILTIKQVVISVAIIITVIVLIVAIRQESNIYRYMFGGATALLIFFAIPFVIISLGSRISWGNPSLSVFGTFAGLLLAVLLSRVIKSHVAAFLVLLGPLLGGIFGFHLLSVRRYKIARVLYLVVFLIIAIFISVISLP